MAISLPTTITVVVDTDTSVVALFEPIPNQCPSRGTLASANRQCVSECKSKILYHDGNCGFYEEIQDDINCCSPCPQGAYTCIPGTNNSSYFTGQRDSVTFECLTAVQVNDPRCATPPSCLPDGARCEVATGAFDCCSGYCQYTPALGPTAGICGQPLPPPTSPVPSPTPVIEGTPPPTPSEQRYPDPSVTSTPVPSITPSTSVLITPTPTPTPIRWRSCVDGVLRDGTPPSAYRAATYQGAGGGVCWEPAGNVGFEPDLSQALTFLYQRGTKQYPQPRTITAVNPSYAIPYSIKLQSNPNVIIEPSVFRLGPRESRKFTVNVTPELLAQLGDGTSTLDLNIEIEQG